MDLGKRSIGSGDHAGTLFVRFYGSQVRQFERTKNILAPCCRKARRASLRLDAGELDDLAEFFGFDGNHLRKIRRSHGNRHSAEISEPLLDLLISERPI